MFKKRSNCHTIAFVCVVGLILGFPAMVNATSTASPGFSAGLAVDFPAYERAYLMPVGAYHNILDTGIEYELGLGLGINVADQANPRFLLPLWAGLDVLFDGSKEITPYIGILVRPQFSFGVDATQFLMGPAIKGGVRFHIHPKASIYAELEQGLMIGPPKWLSTGTRFSLGLAFNTADTKSGN